MRSVLLPDRIRCDQTKYETGLRRLLKRLCKGRQRNVLKCIMHVQSQRSATFRRPLRSQIVADPLGA